jgi:ferric-dicitrate binding protein FerR (iron transport regulator)
MAKEEHRINDPEILDLIAKHLQGELSSHEQSRLFAWVGESQENKLFYDQMSKTWDLLGRRKEKMELDTEEAWKKVKSRTFGKKVKVIRLWNNPVLQVAAGFVLLLTMVYLTRVFLTSNAKTITLAVNEERKMFYLPDSSRVWLNKNSKLNYTTAYMDEERSVHLEGEAFFDVRKNNGKKFKVYGQRSLTVVLGTSFNVKSYKNGDEEAVEVVTGKVSFSTLGKEPKEVILTPGLEGRLDKNNVLSMQKIDDPNFKAWKESRLEFDNTDLATVIKTLNNYFGIEVEVKDPSMLNCRFTASFEKPDAEEILKVLTISNNFSYEKVRNKFILDGPGCDKN